MLGFTRLIMMLALLLPTSMAQQNEGNSNKESLLEHIAENMQTSCVAMIGDGSEFSNSVTSQPVSSVPVVRINSQDMLKKLSKTGCKDYIVVVESTPVLDRLFQQDVANSLVRLKSKYAVVTKGGMEEVKHVLYSVDFLKKVANILVMIEVIENTTLDFCALTLNTNYGKHAESCSLWTTSGSYYHCCRTAHAQFYQEKKRKEGRSGEVPICQLQQW